MLGRTLGGATVALIQGCIVFAVTLAIGFRPSDPQMLPLAALFLFGIALLFTSLGAAIAAKVDDMQSFPLIMNFLVMPLFFLSGALSGVHHFPYTLDAAVLIVCVTVVTIVGSILFSRIEA